MRPSDVLALAIRAGSLLAVSHTGKQKRRAGVTSLDPPLFV